MFKQINVVLQPIAVFSYPIRIGSALLEKSSSWIPKSKSVYVIITDDVVKDLYGILFERTLKQQGYHTLLLSFPAGEQSKNHKTKYQLEKQMLVHGCDRDCLVIALGGGVVGDLAGYIAATFMRGVEYIQIPTTLLAMVDSSVGGKTGIDTPQGKNLLGAFWQPTTVISDTHCLQSLSQIHIVNGLIEALKMFLTSDLESLNFLLQHMDLILQYDDISLVQLVYRAASIKANIVKIDEKDHHQRAILNFGHTIGHALEQLTQYQLLHGYAVAYGILLEAKIAQLMGFLDAAQFELIEIFLNRLGISVTDLRKFNIHEIIERTQMDKKTRSGVVHYVLLHALGQVYEVNNQFAHPVSDQIVKNAFLELVKN